VHDDDFLCLVNPSPDDVTFVVPGEHAGTWCEVLDTVTGVVDPVEATEVVGERVVPGRSLLVLRRARDERSSSEGDDV
jgi:pullulanase/glycogen debranching enzyme